MGKPSSAVCILFLMGLISLFLLEDGRCLPVMPVSKSLQFYGVVRFGARGQASGRLGLAIILKHENTSIYAFRSALADFQLKLKSGGE